MLFFHLNYDTKNCPIWDMHPFPVIGNTVSTVEVLCLRAITMLTEWYSLSVEYLVGVEGIEPPIQRSKRCVIIRFTTHPSEKLV